MRTYLASTICTTGKFTSEILSTSRDADPLYNSSLPSGRPPLVGDAGKQHRVQLRHGGRIAAFDVGNDFQDRQRQRLQLRSGQVSVRKKKGFGGYMARFDLYDTLDLTCSVLDQLDTVGEFSFRNPRLPGL